MEIKYSLSFLILFLAIPFIVFPFLMGRRWRIETISPFLEILIAIVVGFLYFIAFRYVLEWEKIEHTLLSYFQIYSPDVDIKIVEIFREGFLLLLGMLNSLIIITSFELGRTKRQQEQIRKNEITCNDLKRKNQDQELILNSQCAEIDKKRDDLNAAKNLYAIFNLVPRDLQSAIDGLFDLTDPFADHVGSQFKNFTGEIKENGIFLNRNVDLYVNHIEEILNSITRSDKTWEIFMTCLVPPQWFYESDDRSLPPNEQGISSMFTSKNSTLLNLLKLYQSTAESGIAVKRLIAFDDADLFIMKNSGEKPYRNGVEKLMRENNKVIHHITDGKLLHDLFARGKDISPLYLQSLDFVAFGIRENGDVKWQYIVMYNIRGQYLRIMWWNNTEVMKNVSLLYKSLSSKAIKNDIDDYLILAEEKSWPQIR